jgi:predicted small secreted protein
MTPTRTITALALALVVGGLAACDTIEGAGEDLEAVGEAVANTAERTAD